MRKKTASFFAAGDLMIRENEPAFMLQHVAGAMRAADITYVNVEGPICEPGEGNVALTGVGIPIRSDPRVAQGLKDAGVDVVSLANNHTMDYGAPGLDQTLDALRSAGIAYCGAGRNIDEARRAVSVTANGLTVALLSYTSVCPPSYAARANAHGAAVVRATTSYDANPRVLMQPGSPLKIRSTANPDDLRAVKEEVRAAKAQADIVLVAWHWGVSDGHGKIAEYQRELGRAAIDAGAAAILGHHAHMLLGIEHYKGRPIFYSLGNFAFDLSYPHFRPESVLIKCLLDADGMRDLRLIPAKSNAMRQPVPSDEREAQRIAWMLEDMSFEMNAGFRCDGREIEVFPLE